MTAKQRTQMPTVEVARAWARMNRLRINSEVDLQAAVEEMLLRHGIPYEREKILGPKDRPDFFIEDEGLAIELKIKGSVINHLRQCQRYARHECVRQILLMTTLPHFGPKSIGAKPLHYIPLWTSLL